MSGFGTAIEATVGANVNPLRAAGAEIVGVAGGIAGEMTKKFEMKDLGRTLATALGLNLQTAANALVTPFRESAEAASKIAEYTERSANATAELIRLNQTNAQVLAGMQRDAERLRAEMLKPAAEISLWRQALGGVLLHMGAIGTAAEVLSNSQENSVKAARDAAALTEKELQIATQKKKIIEDSNRRALEIDQESFEYEKAHHEQLVLEAKLKIGTILPAERERLNVIRLQVKEAGMQREMAMLLEKPLKSWTQQDKERFAVLQQQTKEIEKQIGLITNPPMPANPPIIETIKGYVAAWDAFVVKVTSSGKGDTQLSDRELARKKNNLEQEIFISGVNRINRIGVGNEGGFDPFGTINESNLRSVEAEQLLRATNRRNAVAFGDDRAFAMSGLSEQRWAAIMRESQDKSEATQELRDLNDNVRTGFDGLAQALRGRG